MQYKPAESLWEHLYPGRNYVLAVGGIQHNFENNYNDTKIILRWSE